MNLVHTFPHSMRSLLVGYVHLARMIDKCRAVIAKTPGEYLYPCPMDDRLLEFASITADQFTQAVRVVASDAAVADWFLQTARPPSPPELLTWNRMMLTRGPSGPESQKHFDLQRNAIDDTRTDLTSWADLQDLEEGRTVPVRSMKAD